MLLADSQWSWGWGGSENLILTLRSGKGEKLRTYIIIDIPVVESAHLPRNRKLFMFMIFRANGNFMFNTSL